MGRLLDGKWVTNDLGSDAQGRYVRRTTQFRHSIPSAEYPAETKRYRLFVSHACGWSHRCLIVRALKGLEEAIPVTYVQPFMGDNGWTFVEDTKDRESLPLNDMYLNVPDDKKSLSIRALHQLYVVAKKDYTGRASVPVLWDMKTGTIVNNESSEILEIFSHGFDSYSDKNIEFVPESRKKEIEEMIQSNYYAVNNGVYRCGFANSQEAYQEAATALFDRLDQLESILERQRYLMGNDLTMADLCLFPTLYRFDTVYHTHFKCNKKHVYEYPNLWGFTKEIYQMAGIKDTCDMEQIKKHYYTSHESIHPRRYIPLGPDLDFESPHRRDDKVYEQGK